MTPTQSIGLGLIVAGVLAIPFTFSEDLRANDAMSDWDSVEGVAVVTGYEEDKRASDRRDTSWVSMAFQYDVNGQRFTAQQGAFCIRAKFDDGVMGLVSQYRQPQPITVYYNPVNPGESLIAPYPPFASWLIYGLVALLIGGGGWLATRK